MSRFELNAGVRSSEKAKAAAGAETQGEVRLRRPERRQMELVPQCTDDLVSATHPVRTVAAVAAKLNLSAFGEASRGRGGGEGRERRRAGLRLGSGGATPHRGTV